MIELAIVIYLLIGWLLGLSFKPLKIGKDTGINAAFMAIAWYPVICLWALLFLISWISSAIKKLFSVF